jgi:hypothetical protein
MNIAFATCERLRALGFLKQIYPSSEVTDTDDSVKDLLDIIEADEMRVCDPAFHGGGMIMGKNAKDDTVERAKAALKKSGLWFAKNDNN